MWNVKLTARQDDHVTLSKLGSWGSCKDDVVGHTRFQLEAWITLRMAGANLHLGSQRMLNTRRIRIGFCIHVHVHIHVDVRPKLTCLSRHFRRLQKPQMLRHYQQKKKNRERRKNETTKIYAILTSYSCLVHIALIFSALLSSFLF